MIFYKKLNLAYPIASPDILEEVYSKPMSPDLWNYYTMVIKDDLQRLINPQLLSQVKSVGLVPTCLVAHERNPSGMSYIHRDVAFQNNQWVKASVTINWELTPGTLEWNWYDTTGTTEGPLPPSYDISATPLFYGVHARPERTKDSHGFQLLHTYHTTKPNQATLYRIDLPHRISYNTNSEQRRRSIGIRFSIDDISTWQQALEIFQEFSVQDLS